ncbi:MAG: hypothetical protein IKC16_01740 [Clostridia bacterium]|nr:hypothetical protein [Clostridia bacterium]
MKIDKGTVDKVLKMDDDQLWKVISYVAKKSGANGFEELSRPNDMTKIRATLASLTDEDIQNAMNKMKRGKNNG